MKRSTRLFGAGVAVLTLAALPPGELEAQYDAPPPPAAYALRNVTVVTADGTRTPGANLVVRGGLVEAVGADVAIPADAKVLEGDSLFVYPGLVDAHASAEIDFPDPHDVEEDDDVVAWDPPRSASGFMPHRKVAHHLAVTGEGVRSQRSKGIVGGLVHPGGGLAPGQPAVVVFRADAEVPWELVLRESAGLKMSFQQARGVYPSQLFGVIAYLRQAFLDAERYATARGAWDSDPTGMTAPSWDPDLEALRMAADGRVPVYFSADSDEDIRRVFDLADETGFRPVIVGGAEAWKLAPEIARRNVPVLVSTDFPEPDEWDPEADTTGAELAPDAAREKERIEDVWSNAGRLEDAGVTFALTTGGGAADLLEGARKAVEHGLSEAGALRALTSTPAGLLGVPSLTRVTPGGGATFIVTEGDLLDDEAGVVYTFVEGRMEEGRALRAEGEGGEPASDVSGEWEGTVGAEAMTIAFTMTLAMEPDGSFSGTMTAEGQGDSDLSGSVSGRDVTLIIEAEGLPEPLRLEGTLSEDGTSMEGGGSTPMGEMEFTATKKPGAASGRDVRSRADLFRGGRSAGSTGGAR